MPSKRKRYKVPKYRHHPSESSIAVPAHIKEEVKRSQDEKCWLCGCKAHKTFRPLEICHILPQARSSRSLFVRHHKSGRIQLYNIHDPKNLVALCSICHFAFDKNEWTFIPEDTTIWTQRIEATPQIIQEYNAQRTVVFRRLLLDPDTESPAFQDTYYKSAFTNSPTKIWSGEPGTLIVRPLTLPSIYSTPELRKTLRDFIALQDLWLEYENPCYQEGCPICQGNNNGKQGKEDYSDDEDDKGDQEGDQEDDKEDDEEEHEDYEDDEEEVQVKRRSIRALKQLKKQDRMMMTSAPYDESIPLSHRWGYS
ncbi:MAG: hypothetical protein Q9163_001024, partial [Psora crenata]